MMFLQCVSTMIIVYIIISPLNSYHYIHWMLDLKEILLFRCGPWIEHVLSTITIMYKESNKKNQNTTLFSHPPRTRTKKRSRENEKWRLKKKSTRPRNTIINTPKKHNNNMGDEEWNYIICGAHFQRALLVNLRFNAKVVSVHMTNALLLFNTLFVQILTLTKCVCITK